MTSTSTPFPARARNARSPPNPIQPLLFQVATASLEQEHIAYPARAVLRKWKGIEFRLGEVTGVDFDGKVVHLAEEDVPYDYLILAAGSVTHYFGMKSSEEQSFDLKSLDKTRRGFGDLDFLTRVFNKLLLNYGWWLSRTDADSMSLFEGGFLGLAISPFMTVRNPFPRGIA